MRQKRTQDKDMPAHAPDKAPADWPQEELTNRNPSADLGTSSDRAMFDDDAESRLTPERPGERGPGMPGGRRRRDQPERRS
jgi:hypothetical protein